MLEEWQIDKENFESYLDPKYVPLSDEMWARIIDDVEGQVANYIDELITHIAVQIEEGEYDD